MSALLEVHIVTYNQKPFIRQAIESALSQKTSYDYKIILGDDGSTDGTHEILLEYQEKYPSLIDVRINPQNRGANHPERIGIKLLLNAKSKYIAWLDGDDYWIDPLKIQKQLDILENHPEFVLCHHWHKNVVRNKAGVYEEKPAPKDGYLQDRITTVADIFTFRLRTQTRTMMFRNIFTDGLVPDWYYSVKFADVTLSLILGKYGKYYFIDEEMAAYRVTGGGVSSIFSSVKGYVEGNKEWMRIWSCAIKYHDYVYWKDAIKGMNVFVSRIRNRTNDSIFQRVKLLWFILFKLNMPIKMKKELCYLC